MTENCEPQQGLVARQRKLTDLAYHDLATFRENRFNGKDYETLPRLGDFLAPSEGLWATDGKTAFRVKCLGSPNSGKTSILRFMHEHFRWFIEYFPAQVNWADRINRRLALFAELEEIHPYLSFAMYAKTIEADLFWSYVKEMYGMPYDRTGAKLAGEIDEKVLSIALDFMYAYNEMKNRGLGFAFLDEFLKDIGIALIDPPITQVVEVTRALGIDITRLSAEDQVPFYELVQLILHHIPLESFVYRAVEFYPVDESLNVPSIIDIILGRADLESHAIFASLIQQGKYPRMGFFDEHHISRIMYHRTFLLRGNIPPERVNPGRLNLDSYYRSLRREATERECYELVALFFIPPALTLKRAEGRMGHILNPDYLYELQRQQIRIYHELLTLEERPCSVISIDASGDESHTFAQFIKGVHKALDLAGIDFRFLPYWDYEFLDAYKEGLIDI